ncbi:aminopeptidase N [Drosophila ficusphila]|uniref:aminopeptidase N n=1 Tax=Drosophila ficusphila TaxID=30025 RepID=UPI0007E68CAF|nr:aminopeptidase N [Drosophila ficusphila]
MARSDWHLVLLQLCLLGAPGRPAVVQEVNLKQRSRAGSSLEVQPLHYNLSLLTEVEEADLGGTIRGVVTIRVKVWRETRTIVLSSKGLKLGAKVWLIRVNTGGRVTVRKIWHVVRLNRLHIVFNSLLWLGEEYNLTLEFSRKLTRTTGYFVGSYLDASQRPEWVSFTQLSPNLANTVFPCFEDPGLTSLFVLNLAHPRSMKAVSIMRVERTSDHERDDYMWTSFYQTPPMSVQKLAFSINRFTERSSPRIPNCPELTTWMRPEVADQGQYAIRIAPGIIVYFIGLFGKPYPSDKIDQLILPDSAYKSHEHVGLVSYPEATFLYSEKDSTAKAKQDVASHLAHEFAHHWFSDLETPDLRWLHYGLSNYLAGFAVDKVEPDWRLHELSMLQQAFAVLEQDSMANAQPVSFASGSQSSSIGVQAYHKSALLFRMLHSLIGTQVFVASMRLYFRRVQKGASNQSLLWKTFQEEADRQMSLRQDVLVSQLMDSWTMQPGYPLIQVVRNYEEQLVTVTQERFLRNPSLANGRRSPNLRHCWYVPLTFTSAGRGSFVSTLPSEWLTCRPNQPPRPLLLKEVAKPDEWVVFNLRRTTPCRINYDERNWQLISEALAGENPNSIDRFTRAQLIGDMLSLANAGVVTYDLALDFLRHLHREDEYIVWKAVARHLEWLYHTLNNTPIFSVYKSFMRGILQPKFKELFMPKDNSDAKGNTTTLKGIVLQLACQMDLGLCANLALKEFGGINLGSNRIPVDQRGTIYCTAIRLGTEADWTLLRTLYKRSNVIEERRMILSALACSRESWALDKLLGLAFRSRFMPKADVLLIFKAVSQNSLGLVLAKRYLMDNIKAIIKLYGNSTNELAQFINVLMEEITTEAELEVLRKFIKEELKDLPGIEVTSRRMLDLGNENVAWHKHHYLRVVSAVCNITGSMEPQCLY